MGHTLIITVNPFVITPAPCKNLLYDPVNEFTVIGKLATGNLALVVNANVLPVHTALPFARAGRLTVIAGSGESRSVLAPDLPRFAEVNLKNLDIDVYYRIAGPAGRPRDVVARVNCEVAAILALPDIRETLIKQGLIPATSSPEEIQSLSG